MNATPTPDDAAPDRDDGSAALLNSAARFSVAAAMGRDLQKMAEPRPLPVVSGVDVAARLLAGSPGLTVGGDWYDATALPDGRIAITVGDVVGHGLRSAVEMTQLRSGMHSLALDGLEPGEVLAAANVFLARTGQARFVTCIHAVFDPGTGVVALANAGHLPPIRLPVAARPSVTTIGSGVPLGGPADLAQAHHRPAVATDRLRLAHGDSLLLFTDGLVESPDQPIDSGIAALIDTLEREFPTSARQAPARGSGSGHGRRARTSAREVCDLLMAMTPGRAATDRDDATALVLRRRL